MEQLKKYRYTLILLTVVLMLCQSSCRLFKKMRLSEMEQSDKKITDGLIGNSISAFYFQNKEF